MYDDGRSSIVKGQLSFSSDIKIFLLYKRNVNVSVKIIVSYPINIIDIRSSFSYFWAPTPPYPPCLCYLLTGFALIRSSKYQFLYYQKRNRSFLWGFFGYHDNFDNVLVLTEKAVIFLISGKFSTCQTIYYIYYSVSRNTMKLTLAISLQDPIDINRVTTLKWTGRDNLNVFKHLEIRFF